MSSHLSPAQHRPSFSHPPGAMQPHGQTPAPRGEAAGRVQVAPGHPQSRMALAPEHDGTQTQAPGLRQRQVSTLMPETDAAGHIAIDDAGHAEPGVPKPDARKPEAQPKAPARNTRMSQGLLLRVATLPVRTRKERDVLYAVVLSAGVPQDKTTIHQVARMVAGKVGPEAMAQEFGPLLQDLRNGGRMDARPHALLMDGMLAVSQPGGTPRTAELFAGLAADGGPAGRTCAQRLGHWLGTREGNQEGSDQPGATRARALLQHPPARAAFEDGFERALRGEPPPSPQGRAAPLSRGPDKASPPVKEEVLAEAEPDEVEPGETQPGQMVLAATEGEPTEVGETEPGETQATDAASWEDSDFSTTDTDDTTEADTAQDGQGVRAADDDDGARVDPSRPRPLARPQLSLHARDLLAVIQRQEVARGHFEDAFDRMLRPDTTARRFSWPSWRGTQLSAAHLDTHRRGHERGFLADFAPGRRADAHRAESLRHLLIELADRSGEERLDVACAFVDHVRTAYVEGRIDQSMLLAATTAAVQLVANDPEHNTEEDRGRAERSYAPLVSLVEDNKEGLHETSPRQQEVNRAFMHAVGSAARQQDQTHVMLLVNAVNRVLPEGPVAHERAPAGRAFYDGMAQIPFH